MAPRKPPKHLQTALNAELAKEKEQKINLGDTAGLKRALDDAVAEVWGCMSRGDHTAFALPALRT